MREPTVRESLISYISDAYKDANGFRPRGLWNFDAMSISDLEALASRLSDEVCAAIEQDRQDELLAQANWEKAVSAMYAHGAADRETAVRWLLDAENLDDYDKAYGSDFINIRFGVGYDYNLLTGQVDQSRSFNYF